MPSFGACRSGYDDLLDATETKPDTLEYVYDYADHRVLEVARPKQGGVPSPPMTTLYAGRDFEVREDDEPVKYAWMGDTRVARITGSLSLGPQVQRFRLTAGWNLAMLSVDAALQGSDQSDPGPTLLEPWKPAFPQEMQGAVWKYDAFLRHWIWRAPPPLADPEAFPTRLPVGQPIYVDTSGLGAPGGRSPSLHSFLSSGSSRLDGRDDGPSRNTRPVGQVGPLPKRTAPAHL